MYRLIAIIILLANTVIQSQFCTFSFDTVKNQIDRFKPKFKNASFIYIAKCKIKDKLTALNDTLISKSSVFPSRNIDYNLILINKLKQIKGDKSPIEEYYLSEIYTAIGGSSWVFETKEVVMQCVNDSTGIIVVGPQMNKIRPCFGKSELVIPFKMSQFNEVIKFISQYKK